MTRRLYLKNADIQKLEGCSPATASRTMQYLRDVLGKKRLTGRKCQPVTIHEYARQMDIPIEIIIKNLNP